jgi:hypothetical protein
MIGMGANFDKIFHACEIGDVSELDNLFEYTTTSDYRNFIDAAFYNDRIGILDRLYEIIPNEFINYEAPIYYILKFGLVRLLDWLLDRPYINAKLDYPLDQFSNNSYLITILNWYYEHRDLVKMNYTCRLVDDVYYKAIEVYNWFLSHKDLEFKYSTALIDNNGDQRPMECLNWWYDNYKLGLVRFEYTTYALDDAISQGFVDIIKWWLEHSNELELKYTSAAFCCDDNEVLNYLLHEQTLIKFIINDDLIDRLGDQRSINFWYENRHQYGFKFTFTSKSIDKLIYDDDGLTLQWWFDHMDSLELLYTEAAIDNCESVKILDIWYNNRHRVQLKYTSKSMDTRNENIIKWWYSKRDELELKHSPCIRIENKN